jgi:NADH-quinone oxidoreductase subunit M
MLSPDGIRFLLPWLIGLPLVTALLLPLFGREQSAARRNAIGAALLHLFLTLLVVASARQPLSQRKDQTTPVGRNPVFVPEFVPGDPGVDRKGQRFDSHATSWDILPFAKDKSKIKAIQFFIGLDGLNIWLLALTSLMLVPVILISWDSIKEGAGAYYAWLFALQAGAIGVFLAFDIIFFYVCFELTLIPLFFLISGWGRGPYRREAARKLFLFTLAGGLITLLGILAAVLAVYEKTDQLTFSIPDLALLMQDQLHRNDETLKAYWREKQQLIFLAIAVGFAVKIPLVPLHSWLPGAYAEAPIGVTVLLSALLAKMGTFGLLRVCLPIAPDGALTAGLPLLGTLAAIGIIYGALCAFAQSDFKRLVAYSSVSHLGFCVLGLMALNAEGMTGGLLHMVNHGLATGALFLLVGFLLQRYSSGQIADYGGLWKKLPVFTFFMMVICLAGIGLPGLNNFVSEMLMLGGLFELSQSRAAGLTYAVVAALGIFLSAWYILTMLQRVFFNPLREPPPVPKGVAGDLNMRELAIIVPLTALCLYIGLRPQPMLDVMRRDIDSLAHVADDARRGHVPPPVVTPPKSGPIPQDMLNKMKEMKEKKGKKDGGKPSPKKERVELLPQPREVK